MRTASFLALGILVLTACTEGANDVTGATDPDPDSTQTADSTPYSEPRINLEIESTSIAAGDFVQGVVTIVIPRGLHGYSPTNEDDALIPVKVLKGENIGQFNSASPTGEPKAVGGSDVPVNVLEGEVKIPISFKLLEGLTGDVEVSMSVQTQLCNEVACFSPEEKELRATISVS